MSDKYECSPLNPTSFIFIREDERQQSRGLPDEVTYSETLVPGHYGNYKGLLGNLNNLVNRASGQAAEGQSPIQFIYNDYRKQYSRSETSRAQ